MWSRGGSALLLVGLLGVAAATLVAAVTYEIDVPSDEEEAVDECEALISQTMSNSRGASLRDPVVSRRGTRWTVEGQLAEAPHDRWRCIVIHEADGGGWDAVRVRNLDP